jgi:hypothetical protein
MPARRRRWRDDVILGIGVDLALVQIRRARLVRREHMRNEQGVEQPAGMQARQR